MIPAQIVWTRKEITFIENYFHVLRIVNWSLEKSKIFSMYDSFTDRY